MVAEAAPIVRVCQTCGTNFEISQGEINFLRLRAREAGICWSLPKRCLPCRKDRRRAMQSVHDDGTPSTLICIRCHQKFVFTANDKAEYAALNLLRPRRCPRCRQR